MWSPRLPPLPEHITDEEILAALADVPQDFRAVALLVDVEEFSYKEAAGILNVPVGTVMSRLSRGRKLLRVRLAPQRCHMDWNGRNRKEKAHESRSIRRRGPASDTRQIPRLLYQQRAPRGD